MTGITLGCENILNFGYSSLKSREIRGVHSLSANILAAISLPCHFPRQVSPEKQTDFFLIVGVQSRCGIVE
jgi:hypothetical protein